ncbi:PIN domain-like protein [Leucogyrophana mollusca]|uniref:PIN domain-like protein n=1 Tax=Leucogyrophana mollusca TaxID=85980 RepID=A0ACB8BAE0_9AGAM|nr:PIN domain-like protein [Leucogyrophana mollusca]
MGVLGLTPFLQKICPEVIKRLPDRLKSLRGKTIVIDGTLITQRLHFAPLPHPHRHVLGWHRIITELKENGVRSICVFDGQERSAAKAREVERRREVRRMDAARGTIEAHRLVRLQKLKRILPQYRSLKSSERLRITEALGKPVSKRRPIPYAPRGFNSTPARNIVSDFDSADARQLQSENADVEPPTVAPQEPSLSDDYGLSEADLQEILSAHIGQGVVITHEPLFQHETETGAKALSSAASVLASQEEVPIDIPSLSLSGTDPGLCDQGDGLSHGDIQDTLAGGESNVFSALSSLYHEYRQCVAQLTSMPSTPNILSTSDFPTDATEARLEYAMSKSQLQMTVDEGRIWDRLVGLPTSSLAEEASITEASLTSLAERSSLISDSYQRRTNPPTSETYDECKEILHAMGVPCIESSGPFEAEALASSLVINGLADYVASEDTDVLVYEAPLIRNIASRDGPLLIVSGSEVRSVLQLDRASYIDFLLLLGTDFSQRIKNVGPQRALKFIREHGSIERMIEQEGKYPPRVPVPTYLKQVEIARLVFQTLPPVPPAELIQPTEGNPAQVSEIIQRLRLHRNLVNDWDYHSALDGNYFADNPSAV